MEIKLSENLFYLDTLTKMIFYHQNKDLILIDTGGSSKDYPLIEETINKYNFNLKYIINTHTHPDHTKNNKILQDKYCCPVMTSTDEYEAILNEKTELAIMYGGNPPEKLCQGFLYTVNAKFSDLIPLNNLKYLDLKGHSIKTLGILIEDKYLCIGDSLYTKKELQEIPYTFNIKDYLNTLNTLRTYQDKIMISAHGGIIENNLELIDLNEKRTKEIIKLILDITKNKNTFEELFNKIISHENITLTINKYLIITSTIKSYLSYLIDESKLNILIENNNLYYVNNQENID